MIPAGTLVLRTLLNVARQRTGLDEAGCRLVLDYLAAAQSVEGVLQRRLAAIGFSEHQFGVLVALFALDPAASTPADLAHHAGTTRSAMTALLDNLETRDLLSRRRDTRDRRLVYVQLTPAGQTAANAALMDYLRAANELAGLVAPADQAALLQASTRIQAAANRISSANASATVP